MFMLLSIKLETITTYISQNIDSSLKERYFISVTEHQLYKSKKNKCNVSSIQPLSIIKFSAYYEKDAPEYDFHACVRTSIYDKVGCRPPWDIWSPKSLDTCRNISQFIKIYQCEFELLFPDQKTIINKTGCLVPCTYKEFEIVGSPTYGSSTGLENKTG